MHCARTLLASLLFIGLQVAENQVQNVRAKLCVVRGKLDLCELLRKSPNADFLDCVTATDRVGCMLKVVNGEANIVNLPSNEAYAASSHLLPLVPLLEEQFNDGEFMYESVAVVRKDLKVTSLADLKGKRSCHTGYRRTAGWDIPIAYLIAQGAINNLVCGDELASISRFFASSCLPGDWSRNPDQNALLKTKFSNLCQLCSLNCNTTGNEEYSGYEGALKCLTEKTADVAFTKHSLVLEFASTTPSFAEDYRLLCPNGTLNSVHNLCFWGARTNPLIVTRNSVPENEKTALKEKLLQMLEQKPWSPSAVGTIVSYNKSIAVRNISGSIKDHLIKGNFSVTMDKPLTAQCHESYARLCVTSNVEVAKCRDWKLAAFATRLRPQVECVSQKTTEECLLAVQKNEAAYTVAGLKATYDGLVRHNLEPLMMETFEQRNFSYFVVAVIKKNSTIKKLADLKGAKSCHSMFMSGASWSIPIGSLASKGLISGRGCDLNKAAARFFSSSCAPGAPTSLPNLCRLCKGDSSNQHACSYADEYAGVNGAFRCLASGGGDVAFVKHTTVDSYTDGRSNELWAKDLKSSDFQLLCDAGVKPVDEFQSCNFGAVPGKQVLISPEKSSAELTALHLMLIQSNFTFGGSSDIFQLYSDYGNDTDVIFTNGTSGLASSNGKKKTAKEILGDQVFNFLEMTACTSNSIKLTLPWWVLIVLGFWTVRTNSS